MLGLKHDICLFPKLADGVCIKLAIYMCMYIYYTHTKEWKVVEWDIWNLGLWNFNSSLGYDKSSVEAKGLDD